MRRLIGRSLGGAHGWESGCDDESGRCGHREENAHASIPPPDLSALIGSERRAHAALLARCAARLGAPPRRRRAPRAAQLLLRSLLGPRIGQDLLGVADTVRFCRLASIRDRTIDPVVEMTCSLVLAEMADHLTCRAEETGAWLATLLPWERMLWRVRIQVLFAMALGVGWAGHARCLRALGGDGRGFLGAAQVEFGRFIARVHAYGPGAVPQTAGRLAV